VPSWLGSQASSADRPGGWAASLGLLETSLSLGHLNGKGEVTRMTKKDVYPLIGSLYMPLVAFLASAAIFSGCSRASGQTQAVTEAVPILNVKLATVSDIQVPRVLALSGTLTGNEQAKVAAGAAGKVIATFVERVPRACLVSRPSCTGTRIVCDLS
jgi:hypothetical protein